MKHPIIPYSHTVVSVPAAQVVISTCVLFLMKQGTANVLISQDQLQICNQKVAAQIATSFNIDSINQ